MPHYGTQVGIALFASPLSKRCKQKCTVSLIKETLTLVERVGNGIDLFDRPGEIYDMVKDNQDVPLYVSSAFECGGRFEYLINRTNEDAGFDDWPASSFQSCDNDVGAQNSMCMLPAKLSVVSECTRNSSWFSRRAIVDTMSFWRHSKARQHVEIS